MCVFSNGTVTMELSSDKRVRLFVRRCEAQKTPPRTTSSSLENPRIIQVQS